jgi:transcriptional regulator with XRE-family HTH domain
MTVEIGHKIKAIFDARNMKLTEFADELGTVRQNVYRIFKKRHLDTGLLLKISKVLEYNFFQCYVAAPSENGDEDEQTKQLKATIVDYQRQLDLAKKEVDYLRKIIHLMEEKAELVEQLEKEIILH